MAAGASVKSSKVIMDGSFIFTKSSGRQTNAASAVPAGHFVAPFAGLVVDFHLNIDTQFTHASSKLNFGKLSDSDSHLDGFVLQNLATGYRNIIGDALWVTKQLSKGEMYMFETEAADTTGKYCADVVVAAQANR